MLYGDDLIDECCKSKAKHQVSRQGLPRSTAAPAMRF